MKFYLFLAINTFVFSQSLLINEVVSSNSSVFYDEDGDTPDWVEIYNSNSTAVNLKGYGFSDDLSDKLKWKFPETVIQPMEYLLVLASDKDKNNIVNSWDGEITIGDEWKYWVGINEPPSDWNAINFNSSNWSEGPSGFGYGDGDDNTVLNQTISVYVRRSFTVENVEEISVILFHLDYDDGYVAYINGKEFSRRNLGPENSNTSYNQTATGLHEADIYQGGFPEEIILDPNLLPLQSGENTIAIEVHNFSNSSSDLTCIPFLTIGYKSTYANLRVPDKRINLPETYLHTNFKIKSTGEYLVLSDSNGVIVDSVFSGSIPTDRSKGRVLGGSSWKLFDTPTPEKANPSIGYNGFLSPPIFSIKTGFYSTAQKITLAHFNSDAKIYYTLDGSEPNENSYIYNTELTINTNTVIRARSMQSGWMPSNIETQTYLFDTAPDIPVIALNADPKDLFDSSSGIYSRGPSAADAFPHFGANFWQDWEKPAQFDIIDTNGNNYSASAGIKIFGGWSRGNPQKSFSLFARKQYGTSQFDYQIFPKSSVDSYESFIIRNSGNDWEQTMLRDGYVNSIIDVTGVDYQQYRPAIGYINGEYWGIYNMREKISEHFISSHHDVPTDKINLLAYNGGFEDNLETIHGSKEDFLELIQYISTNDMTKADAYNVVSKWIDIEEYIEYQIIQIFIDNRDWPGNNVKLWRDSREGGKWRWILYDADYGFAFPKWMTDHHKFNTLDFALATNGPGWPNPPWSTYLFRKLMDNDSFKNRFINHYSDLLNTIFLPENLNDKLESTKKGISKYIKQHHQRWNQGYIDWDYELARMKEFSDSRAYYAKRHIRSTFNLSRHKEIKVSTAPAGYGRVDVNSLTIDNQWSGDYFPGVPIAVTAVPKTGFKFKEWKGIPDSLASINVDVGSISSFEAVFEADLSVDEEILLPTVSELKPAFPNPFNSSITIPYNIHTRSDVTITISNILGQKILSFNFNSQLPGNYKVTWNGTNHRNISVSGGVYIVTLQTEKTTDFKKIILLK